MGTAVYLTKPNYASNNIVGDVSSLWGLQISSTITANIVKIQDIYILFIVLVKKKKADFSRFFRSKNQ